MFTQSEAVELRTDSSRSASKLVVTGYDIVGFKQRMKVQVGAIEAPDLKKEENEFPCLRGKEARLFHFLVSSLDREWFHCNKIFY